MHDNYNSMPMIKLEIFILEASNLIVYNYFFQCLKTSAFCGEYRWGKGTDIHRKEVLFLSPNILNINETVKAITKFLF